MAGPARVFLSYSNKDTALVNRLKTALAQAGVDVWLDHEQLTPGTPDWRAAVVKGIEQATDVVYAASLDAAESPYVGHELAIATDEGKRILPFWVRGEKWSRCAPMGYYYAQRIDGRDADFPAGMRALLATLGVTPSASAETPVPPQPHSARLAPAMELPAHKSQPAWNTDEHAVASPMGQRTFPEGAAVSQLSEPGGISDSPLKLEAQQPTQSAIAMPLAHEKAIVRRAPLAGISGSIARLRSLPKLGDHVMQLLTRNKLTTIAAIVLLVAVTVSTLGYSAIGYGSFWEVFLQPWNGCNLALDDGFHAVGQVHARTACYAPKAYFSNFTVDATASSGSQFGDFGIAVSDTGGNSDTYVFLINEDGQATIEFDSNDVSRASDWESYDVVYTGLAGTVNQGPGAQNELKVSLVYGLFTFSINGSRVALAEEIKAMPLVVGAISWYNANDPSSGPTFTSFTVSQP